MTNDDDREPVYLTVCLTQGLPASGKSTYARKLVGDGYKRVNRDDLRAMMDAGVWSTANEKLIVDVERMIVRKALVAGKNVVIDDTNLTEKVVKDWVTFCQGVAQNTSMPVMVTVEPFNLSVEECLLRNSKREGAARVPDEVIVSMAVKAGLYEDGQMTGKLLEGRVWFSRRETSEVLPVNDLGEPKDRIPAVVCDLDGTLALFQHHRSPYDATTCDKDAVNEPVARLVEDAAARGDQVIFCSGREDKFRLPTEQFLRQVWSRPGFAGAKPYVLLMRKTNDRRKDAEVKKEIYMQSIYPQYQIRYVLDDRNQVVDMWRSLGLSCLQVAPGDF